MSPAPVAHAAGWGVPGQTMLRRLVAAGLSLGVLMGCWWLLKIWAYGQIPLFVLALFTVGLLFWTVFADRAWWVVVPVAVSWGGFFIFNFKILVHEAGILVSLAPLALQRVLIRERPEPRPRLPIVFHLLLGYVVFHFFASVYLAKLDGLYGMGNIVRVYARALWPLLFAMVFHRFGKSSVLRTCFLAMYSAASLRLFLSSISPLLPPWLQIPGINFVLASASAGMGDLRISAVLFGMMNLCLASMAPTPFRRILHGALVVLAGGLLLMGSGRSMFLFFSALLLFFAVVRRRPLLMGSWLAVLVLLASVVNLYPELLYRLAPPVRRTLSVLVVDRPTVDVHRDVRISDDWHFELMRLGRKNWLQSPASFLVGNRVYPLREAYYSQLINDMARAEIAASVTAYESGLWTVLATLGVAGAALYALVFRTLLRGLWTEVREHGLRDYRHGFYFIALATSVLWLLFCWIAGHFPSQELMFAAIAHAARQDELRESAHKPEAEVP